jgi:hypothetical protein
VSQKEKVKQKAFDEIVSALQTKSPGGPLSRFEQAAQQILQNFLSTFESMIESQRNWKPPVSPPLKIDLSSLAPEQRERMERDRTERYADLARRAVERNKQGNEIIRQNMVSALTASGVTEQTAKEFIDSL